MDIEWLVLGYNERTKLISSFSEEVDFLKSRKIESDASDKESFTSWRKENNFFSYEAGWFQRRTTSHKGLPNGAIRKQ